MCGRIGRPELSWREIYERLEGSFDYDTIQRDPSAPDLPPSWNVKPTHPVDIALMRGSTLYSTVARWWFVPDWYREPAATWKQTTFNARIETADEKPSFRQAMVKGRCAIPVTGYYEWTGTKATKQPWWITTQRNEPAMFFAGLASFRDDGLTCTILTRPALPQIADIHSRTPVILSATTLRPWLTGDMSAADAKADLGTEWDGRMIAHKVQPFKRDDDGPELIEPWEPLL